MQETLSFVHAQGLVERKEGAYSVRMSSTMPFVHHQVLAFVGETDMAMTFRGEVSRPAGNAKVVCLDHKSKMIAVGSQRSRPLVAGIRVTELE